MIKRISIAFLGMLALGSCQKEEQKEYFDEIHIIWKNPSFTNLAVGDTGILHYKANEASLFRLIPSDLYGIRFIPGSPGMDKNGFSTIQFRCLKKGHYWITGEGENPDYREKHITKRDSFPVDVIHGDSVIIMD